MKRLHRERHYDSMTTHSGFFVESARYGNFELVAPSTSADLIHGWRNNHVVRYPWAWSRAFPSLPDRGGPTWDISPWSALTLLESHLGDELDAFVLVDERFPRAPRLQHIVEHTRHVGGSWTWRFAITNDPGRSGLFSSDSFACGPAVVRSPFGAHGNYELVIGLERGGLRHYYRDNDDPALTWHGHTDFASSLGTVDGVAMIASNFGPGNLEVVAQSGSRLWHAWRNARDFTWHTLGASFAADVAGTPAFIQSTYGSRGNFELVAARSGGGVEHWWRDNDDPQFPWRKSAEFAHRLGVVDGVAIAQSHITATGAEPHGNLEVVIRRGDDFFHWYRDDLTGQWWEPQAQPVLTRW
jgi:hypothetical protein